MNRVLTAASNKLPLREVKTAFFLVETRSPAGSIKTLRNASQIKQMIEEANKYILVPQTNVTIIFHGQVTALELDLPVSRETGINSTENSVRFAFCEKRVPTAHFTVFFVSKLTDPEATYLPEQFCLIEDGLNAITSEVSYGAYCLAHAIGHLLNHQNAAAEHSPNKGDLMYRIMELGGPRISPDDARIMNAGAGKLKPSTFPCLLR
jgi:hypothetical protein